MYDENRKTYPFFSAYRCYDVMSLFSRLALLRSLLKTTRRPQSLSCR